MKVKIKKLHEAAVIPIYGREGDAALDITCTEKPSHKEYTEFVRGYKPYLEYRTGLSFEIPEGHVGLLFPRSSISKTTLSLANSVGVVDSNFRGEVTFRFKGTSHKMYNKGDRIGQIIIIPIPTIEFEEVEELSETVRGDQGYGSSGQ